MTYTKEQLRAMQSAGVPIEAKDTKNTLPEFREWHLPSNGGKWMFGQPGYEYRPQPGFTFTGYIPRKLHDAGIALERRVGGVWCRAFAELSAECVMTYRIADAEPFHSDIGLESQSQRAEIERLTEERDDLQSLFDLVVRQRDEARARVDKIREATRLMQEGLQ